jgi:mannose-6-phosphate isomerase
MPGLLAKYIFTSDRLSIQNHPGGPQGKEECWLVIAAEPGASLGIGLREELSRDAIRAAALDGSIVDLLAWQPVRPGDLYYIPAGTVHAIGAGVSLIEVQQANDVTYRLFDYGRPRELHLDAALAAAITGPYDPALHRRVPPSGSVALIDGPWFRLDRIEGAPDAAALERYAGPVLVLPRLGTAHIAGQPVLPGECALAPELALLELAERGQALVAQPCTP